MEPTLRCPSCGNNLAAVDAPTVTCAFCKMTVPVPAVYRRPVQVVVAQNPYAPQPQAPAPFVQPMRMVHVRARGGSPAGAIAIVALVVMFVGMGAAFFLVRSGSSRTSAPTAQTAVAQDDHDKKPEPLLAFGGKGTGAGRFEDARALDVGPDGEIWVAEYSDGRVQQFDAKGKFVRVIQVPPPKPDVDIDISSIAADHAGHLFVARNGAILRFSTASGALEKTIEAGVWSLAVDPANTVWGVDESDTVQHFDGEGKLLHKWTDVIKSANKKDPAMSPEIDVDGAGHVALGSLMSGLVYVYDAEMHFQNRFAVKGTNGEPDTDVTDVAFDPRGHLFVGHLWTISEFTVDGTFVGDVQGADPMRSIAFDAKGHLFFMRTNDQKVVELEVKTGDSKDP